MTKPINILYVDDYPLDRELVRDALEKEDGGFQIIEAASRAEFEMRLAEGGCDLVLSDFNILGFKGLQVIDAVRAEKGSLPVVILTGTGSEEVAVEAIKRGATDYVVKKPHHIQRLPLTLRAVLDRVRAEEALRESEEKYRLVFGHSLVSIWEEDFSGVKSLFDNLKTEGVIDIETYFAEHPETVRQCADLIKIVDVNRAALALHGAATREELLMGLTNTFTPEFFETFRHELVCLWNGGTEMTRDAVVQTLAGEPRNVTVYFSVCPSYEDTLSKVLVSLTDITERKRAQKALPLFRSLIDHTNDGIEVIDPETGRFLDVNKQACLAHGYTREEYLALTVPQINHEVSALSWEEAMEMSRRSGSFVRESQHRRKDGSIFPVEINANYIHLDRDYVLAVVRDITERKLAEEERQTHLRFLESMNRVNLAIQGTNDLEQMMSDVLDLVLSIFECDRAFLLYPCDPEAVTWRVPMERNKPEYPGAQELGLEIPMDADVAETLRLLLAADGPVKFGPGTPHPLPADVVEQFGFKCFMSMALYPKVGKPWQFGVHQCSYPRVWTPEEERLFQEIGRRLTDALTSLLAYQELQRSEERLRLTLEAAQIGIWDWDVQHDRWYASPSYYTMLGYEPKEGLANRSEWLARLHPEDRAAVYEKIQDVLTRDFQDYRYEARMRHADGAYRWVSVVGFKIQRDQDGQVTRMVGIRVDITERKWAEEEIRRLNQELEQRVRERTIQLEAANKELEAFAYSVSHDLRAPLRHIDGFLGLLHTHIAESLDTQSRHYMNTIADSARRMGLLIDDLLSFSRMGRHELSAMPVDLNRLVREVIRELASEAAGRAINWRIADLPVVTGDRAMLRIVFVNLIANAVKFTRPRDRAEIEIGCQSAQDTDAVIFVRDNGVGFDMQYANKLFGVFQRLHRAEDFEGTGIGLANVQRIIHRHGGRIWAESEMGKGVAFYFTIP